MIHRYRINRRPVVDKNGDLVTGYTTTWVSGETFDNIQNVTQTVTNSIDQTLELKHLTIPIKLDFQPTDNAELINDWVNEQVIKRINSVLDGERITYKPETEYNLTFRFLGDDGTYDNTYTNAGFVEDDYTKNRFTKSYFRLYFYDTNDINGRLLFTEDILLNTPDKNNKIKFTLPNLIWEREDPLMRGTDINRSIYVNARFFNAKTGVVSSFINLPNSITEPINITEYSSNESWRFVKITLINPNNNNGEFVYRLDNGGGTTDSGIIFSQLEID